MKIALKRAGLCSAVILFCIGCVSKAPTVTIEESLLKDKIAGGWAGKMIGVTYGAPTEFRAQGCTYEDSIRWTPADIIGALTQDDIYVQLTFMETMDQYGMDAPAKLFHERFAKAGYPLWHANVQSRKNYFDSIFPPQSGEPAYNLHADDIDFQIEADYIGFICPGMPRTAQVMADKIGRIMNYGDGLYGGIYVAALYAEAFFNKDIPSVVTESLKAIPAGSEYAQMVRDVIALHQHYPTDWRKAWQELENKWGKTQICEAGSTFNIDAKLNGAYIVMGLLYGEGDLEKTMEISTRCGQDSDCNPSNAVAVLGVMNGFSSFPQAYRDAVLAMQDSLFINTSYSFNTMVDRTLYYAKENILGNGGAEKQTLLTIRAQVPEELPLEEAFPKTVFAKRELATDASFVSKGHWSNKPVSGTLWGEDAATSTTLWSETPGDELVYTFTGTGVSITGSWFKEGGKADVYVDGNLVRTIDTYFDYANQEHHAINLFHILGLPEAEHQVRLVVRAPENPQAKGNKVAVAGAIVYKTAPKAHENYSFSFEKK